MKHVILQMLNEAKKSDELFHGLDSSWVKDNCIVIDQLKTQDHVFSVVAEQQAWQRFQIDPSQDWANIMGNVKQDFLGTDSSFQLDLIADASGAGTALSVMQTIQKICLGYRILPIVKLLFLAEMRSPFYADEQNLYDEIKQAVRDSESGQPKYRWNCVYLLIPNNKQQQELEDRLLPYLLQFDCSSNNQNVRAFGAQIRTMDIQSIEQVPRELSIQAACSVLNRNPKTAPLSVLLLGTNANGLSSGDQLSKFQSELNSLESIHYPFPVDLLVQKQSPLGEVSTRDLFRRFCDDNPQSNPAYYDNASIDALARMPLIAKAVRKWVERVIEDGCAAGDLTPLIDMLTNNSSFDQLLRGYHKPEIMNTEKMLTAQDGYSDIAIRKLEPYIAILQQQLDNAVFAARIRLIRSRMPAIRNQLIQIRQRRQKAAEQALAENSTHQIRDLIDSWSRKISAELFNESLQIDLPGAADDTDTWIQRCAGKMLSRIVPPDLDEGRKELYHSGMRIIEKMGVQTGEVLLPTALSNSRKLADKWIVYDQFNLHRESIASAEPVVIKLVEFELDLQDSTTPDHQLFMAPLTPPSMAAVDCSVEGNIDDSEADEGTGGLPDFHEEQLEEFRGTLVWIWDNTQYGSARVEVYADTGTAENHDEPVFTKIVQYRPDDRYSIGKDGKDGKDEKLPSGVPLVFRIIYMDHGKDVESITREIRMKAPRTELNVTRLEVIEGKKMMLFGGKPYVRLKITPTGSFEPNDIAVGSSSGHFYSAAWEHTDPEGSWLSELLPSMEAWRVVDRPGDLIEYQINQ